MRIIHTSDLHLGTTSYGTEDPSTGLNRRILDFFGAFDQCLDYAVEKKADVIIICGDIFKDISPSSTLLKMFAGRVRRLTSAGVEVVMLLGNHDAPKTAGRAAPPEVFDELKLERVHVFSEPDFVDIRSGSGDKARIFALPYRHPIHVAARVERIGRTNVELDRNKLLAAFQQEAKRNLEIFSKVGKKGADIGVLAAHTLVEGARRGAEQVYVVGEEFAVPPALLQLDVFDFIALGHVHSHQALPGRVPTVYSGSLERIDLSEADEEKGFVDIAYESGRIEWRFVPVKTRPMVKLEVDCTKLADANRVVSEVIDNAPVKDAIVRLVLRVRTDTAVDMDLVRAKLAPAFWHQVGFDRVTDDAKSHAATAWTSLNLYETLARFLKDMKVSKSEMELLSRLGREIVAEVQSEAEAT